MFWYSYKLDLKTWVMKNLLFRTLLAEGTYFEPLSLDSRNKQPEERRIEAEKQSRSVDDIISAFLLFSSKPIRSSITITWPSLVFSSFTDFISNHRGLSWNLVKIKTIRERDSTIDDHLIARKHHIIVCIQQRSYNLECTTCWPQPGSMSWREIISITKYD